MRKYHSIDYAAFGARIANRRKELHLTQQALAEQLECAESYISRIEHGKAQPTLDFIVLFAKALGVGVDYFLPQTKTAAIAMRIELQERWQDASPELLDFLNQIAKAAESFEKSVAAPQKNQ